MDNILEYRNIQICESGNSDVYSDIKQYPILNWSITSLLPTNHFFQINFVNEFFVELLNEILIEISFDSVYDSMKIYYSVDALNFVEIDDIIDDTHILLNDNIVCKQIRFEFINSTKISINKIELYETINQENDYKYYFRQYKINELKESPSFLLNRNLGKLVTEFMNVVVDV